MPVFNERVRLERAVDAVLDAKVAERFEPESGVPSALPPLVNQAPSWSRA